jgi:hypothetical protein
MHADMHTCFDFTNKLFHTRRTSFKLMCVNTNNLVIVARFDILTAGSAAADTSIVVTTVFRR